MSLAIELAAGHTFQLALRRTFGEATPDSLLLYQDSAGNLAVAVANGDAAGRLGLATGDAVRVRRA
jgi:S-adenosylmethionine hydrolase